MTKIFEDYLKTYGDGFRDWDAERCTVIWIFLIFTLSYLLSRNFVISGIISIGAAYMLTPDRPLMSISPDGCTLTIKNPSNGTGFPKIILPKYIMGVIYRLFFPGESTYGDVRIAAGAILNTSSPKITLRTYQPSPPRIRRQILLANHTHTPIRDAFSFFAFIPPESEIIVVQHNFNWVITMVAKRLYGAWTIDKDDKSSSGKKMLVDSLSSLLEYIRTKKDCTVVIYPAGKVPKSPEEEIGRFYPGAFYLALMSGYFITPLVNRYSREGEFSATLYPSVNVCLEYRPRIIPEKSIEKFRKSNSDVLNEMCGRFRKYYLLDGDRVKDFNKIVEPPLHGVDIGT